MNGGGNPQQVFFISPLELENMIIFKVNAVASILLLLIQFSISTASLHPSSRRIFNVKDYGAIGDGKRDDAEAVQAAWNAMCAWEGTMPRLVIPQGKFLVGQLAFKGPCRSKRVVVQVNGTVLAHTGLSADSTNDWISFRYIDGLLLAGGGKFDGRGASAWRHNDCHVNRSCKTLPWSLSFSFITNATVRGITSINSKSVHMQIFACENMKLRSVKLIAPADSPNTDCIHLGLSSNIDVRHSVIGTGDDCISVGPGTQNVSVSDVFCGPGHGISIGSLGGSKDEGDVINVSVRNCTFTDTTNGVRIKTWQESPTASAAYNLKFEELIMRNVENPIIIDQKYCPHNMCSNKGPSLVKISKVKFHKIKGDTRTKKAINLLCSEAVPCEGIELSDINLKYNVAGELAVASYANVKGHTAGHVIPSFGF